MMNKWILISICMLAGCTNKTTGNLDCETIVFDEESEISNESPVYQFIPLETRDDNLIGHINKAEIVDQRIFILDMQAANTVQVYDISGKYIARIGMSGNGPGEYIKPYNFQIDTTTQTITIEDMNQDKFFIYDLNTYQYLSSRKVPFYYHAHIPLADGNHAWYSAALGYKKARELYYIQITDSLFQSTKYYYPAEYLSSQGVALSPYRNFYKYKDKIRFYFVFTPVIHDVTSDGLKPVYKLSFGKHLYPTTDYLNSISNNGNGYFHTLLNSDYVATYCISETDTFITSVYMVHNKMHVGIYDKMKQKTYRYADFTGEPDGISCINIPFIGTYQDCFISTVSPHTLKQDEQKTKHKDFRDLSEKISEEDNPIICLIKFPSK